MAGRPRAQTRLGAARQGAQVPRPSMREDPPSPHQVGGSGASLPQAPEGRLCWARPLPGPVPPGTGRRGRNWAGTLPLTAIRDSAKSPFRLPPCGPLTALSKETKDGGKILKGARTRTGAGAQGRGQACMPSVPQDSCARVPGLAAGLPRACTADGHMRSQGHAERPAWSPPSPRAPQAGWAQHLHPAGCGTAAGGTVAARAAGLATGAPPCWAPGAPPAAGRSGGPLSAVPAPVPDSTGLQLIDLKKTLQTFAAPRTRGAQGAAFRTRGPDSQPVLLTFASSADRGSRSLPTAHPPSVHPPACRPSIRPPTLCPSIHPPACPPSAHPSVHPSTHPSS